MKLDGTKRTLVVAQDAKLVKVLSGNNPKLRNKALKSLRTWFDIRSLKIPFTEQEFIRIWKGLFYAMWMSDKPLVQEECAEKISQLMHFSNVETSLLFFKSSLTVLAMEWFGIDNLRLNKFLMFVRRILRQALFVLKNNKWKMNSVTQFTEIINETILQHSAKNHLGLTMHVIEIYLEELAKVSRGKIAPSLMTVFLKPFVKFLATLNDGPIIGHVKKYLFNHLLHQSDEGMEYQAKFEAWKGQGFPGGSIDAMQKIDDFEQMEQDEECSDDEDIGNKPLDPRAGEVDVDLPQLKFNAREISKLLLEFKFVEGSTVKSRSALTELSKKFLQISKGKFPLGLKKVDIPDDDYLINIKRSLNQFVKFEKQLMGNDRKQKLKRKIITASPIPSKKFKMDTSKALQGASNNEHHVDHSKKNLVSFVKKMNGKKMSTIKKKKKIYAIETKSPIAVIQRNSGVWLVEPLEASGSNCNSDQIRQNYVTTDSKKEFPQSEWDLAPKEGEIEIFVPSNKYKRKIKVLAKTPEDKSLLLRRSLEKLRPRYSLEANLVRNPFSNTNLATPNSEKKVKINLKMNSSQEVYEHIAQIRRSPAIPFDATKKPVKPLLKSSLASPINPFCKKLLRTKI